VRVVGIYTFSVKVALEINLFEKYGLVIVMAFCRYCAEFLHMKG